MKKSLLYSALAIGAYYVLRQFLNKEEPQVGPPKKHLTKVFSKAKEHAVESAEATL